MDLVYGLLLVIYVVVVLLMIVAIILNEPKASGGLGAMFGGVQQVMSPKTAPTVIRNVIVGLGVSFALLALILSMMSGQRRVPAVFKELPQQTAPVQQR